METRRVLREALIAYEGNRYSVPAAFVGERVTVKEDFLTSSLVHVAGH